jgi:hypothetical protein
VSKTFTKEELRAAWATPAGLRAHVLRHGPPGYDVFLVDEIEKLRAEAAANARYWTAAQSFHVRHEAELRKAAEKQVVNLLESRDAEFKSGVIHGVGYSALVVIVSIITYFLVR